MSARFSQGFTLLEIMLAMLVLGMVVSMITLSLSSSLSVISSTQDQGDIYYRAEVTMQRIQEDLASAILPPDIDFLAEAGDSNGQDADNLIFASMAHIVFDPEYGQPGMGIIGYTVRPDQRDENSLVLLRHDTLYRPQEEGSQQPLGEGFLLCDRLRSVSFRYHDATGEEYDSWSTERDEGDTEKQRRLPVRVSYRLEFWLDPIEETTLIFTGSVVLPVGLIQVEEDESS